MTEFLLTVGALVAIVLILLDKDHKWFSLFHTIVSFFICIYAYNHYPVIFIIWLIVYILSLLNTIVIFRDDDEDDDNKIGFGNY